MLGLISFLICVHVLFPYMCLMSNCVLRAMCYLHVLSSCAIFMCYLHVLMVMCYEDYASCLSFTSIYFQVFHDVAYRAQTTYDLINGLDEFLDAVTLLPPSNWDPVMRIDPPPKNPPLRVCIITYVDNIYLHMCVCVCMYIRFIIIIMIKIL